MTEAKFKKGDRVIAITPGEFGTSMIFSGKHRKPGYVFTLDEDGPARILAAGDRGDGGERELLSMSAFRLATPDEIAAHDRAQAQTTEPTMTEYTTKPYEPNWPHGYVTRKGYPVRILATDLVGVGGPIAYTFLNSDGGETLAQARANGRLKSYEDVWDILCKVPKPKPRTIYAVMSPDPGFPTAYFSDRRAAEDQALKFNAYARTHYTVHEFVEVVPGGGE